ncbi:MAG: hypothetical protein DLM56_15245 [Pseudonocardiales bacterium]|nr:MAG: hypothetical protein DLM56_15245 [Pseudonocardiales bacterium]
MDGVSTGSGDDVTRVPSRVAPVDSGHPGDEAQRAARTPEPRDIRRGLRRSGAPQACSFCGRTDGLVVNPRSGSVAICANCALHSAQLLRGAATRGSPMSRAPLARRRREISRLIHVSPTERLRRGAVLAVSPVWLRAPARLWRHPAVLMAIVGSMIVLAIAAASGPLFIASSRSATLHRAVSAGCPESTLPSIGIASTDGGTLAQTGHAVDTAITRAGLPAPYRVARSSPRLVHRAGGATSVTLFSRAGVLDHVQLLTPRGRSGVWIPDTFATSARLRAGSRIGVTGPDALAGAVVALTVAGVYRDLDANPVQSSLPRYWCSWSGLLSPQLEKRAPPLLLADDPTVIAVPASIDVQYFIPIKTASLDVATALAAERRTAGVVNQLPNDGVFGHQGGHSLAAAIANATEVGRSLSGVTVPITIAGGAAALLLVAGAAVFWTRYRSRELRLLAYRGAGPGALCWRAVLELLPAIVLGAVAGWFSLVRIVGALGPTNAVPSAARADTVAGVCLATAAALVVVVLVVFATVRRIDVAANERTSRRGPWESLLLGAAAVCYYLVRRHGAASVRGGIVHINPLVVAFPLLALAGTSLLLARVAATSMRRVANVRSRGVVGFLAMRRISGTPLIALGLAIATALPTGILTYAVSLSDSVRTSVREKYQGYVGAEHALVTLAQPGAAIDTSGRGTVVSVIDANAGAVEGQQVAVLGIDPATFRRFAANVGDVGAVTKLSAPPTGPIPVIAVNAGGMNQKGLNRLALRSTTLPVHVVATTRLFPGLRNGYQPMLVLARASLRNVDPYVQRHEEVWTTAADLSACTAVLHRDGVPVSTEISSSQFIGATGLAPLTWIFGYLRALAILAGLVALAGLVFAAAARLRQDTVAYILAARMGLSRGRHRRSLALEFGTVVLTGWICGAGLALAAFAAVYRLLDVNPSFPPPTPFGVPTTTLAITFAVIVGCVVAAAAGMQRALDRADAAETLRLT